MTAAQPMEHPAALSIRIADLMRAGKTLKSVIAITAQLKIQRKMILIEDLEKRFKFGKLSERHAK